VGILTPTEVGIFIPTLTTVPMRLPGISALIRDGSRLLECLYNHYLIEESSDEVLHAFLLIGKIICDKV